MNLTQHIVDEAETEGCAEGEKSVTFCCLSPQSLPLVWVLVKKVLSSAMTQAMS